MYSIQSCAPFIPKKHESLQLAKLFLRLFAIPAVLTYLPAYLALVIRMDSFEDYYDSPGPSVPLPRAVLVSIVLGDSNPQHYVLGRRRGRPSTSSTTLQAISKFDSLSTKSIFLQPPDAATALQQWSEMLSTVTSWPVQLEAIHESSSEWCLTASITVSSSESDERDLTSQDRTEKLCKTGSLEGIYVLPSGETFARVTILMGSPSQRVAALTGTNLVDKMTTTTTSGFRKNPNKRKPSIAKRLYPLLCQFAFVILAALQIYLFIVYWNGNVSPSAVGKIYTNMFQDGELWRALSGSMSHFNLWHIGLNMSAFYQLSQVLQSDFPPIMYLGLNLSFLGLVSAFWMLWQFGVHRRTSAPETLSSLSVPTVGYSGVLFALSTIVTLEQSQACPIPFVESVCFSTYTFGRMRFSIAPFIQLAIVQLILPRVSFAGHLAGVVVGHLSAWGILPPTWTMYPSIVWPFLQFLYLEVIAPYVVGNNSGRRLGDARSSVSTVLAVPGIPVALLVFVFSGFSFSWRDPLVCSYMWTVVFWTRSNLVSGEHAVVWKRAFCVHAVVLLVTHAVTLGTWTLLPTLWMTLNGALSVLAQAVTLCWGLLLVLDEVRHTEGIFQYTLVWTILKPLSKLQSSWRLAALDAGSPVRSFPGEGRRLRETESELV